MDGDWVVLGLEYVEARAPRRPWRTADLERAASTRSRPWPTLLTPAPAGPRRSTRSPTSSAAWPAFWDHVNATRDLTHGDETRRRSRRASPRSLGGDTLVHTDVRDDNVLLAADGRTLFCDWNWPTVGADWLDSLFMLIGPRGDGLDVESVIAERRLLRDVPPDDLDRALAVTCGYFLRSADEPVPPTSPLRPRRAALAGRGGLGLALRAPGLERVTAPRAVGVRAPYPAIPERGPRLGVRVPGLPRGVVDRADRRDVARVRHASRRRRRHTRVRQGGRQRAEPRQPGAVPARDRGARADRHRPAVGRPPRRRTTTAAGSRSCSRTSRVGTPT